MNKYGGVTDDALRKSRDDGNDINLRLEAVHGVACELYQRLDDLVQGDADDLDLLPVKKHERIDRGSLKVRTLTCEEPMQQCYDHLAVLGLRPLLHAKLLPWQFASIPGKGQTGGTRQLYRWLNKKAAHTNHAEKVDVHHAYQNTTADAIMALLRKDIPRAAWQLALVAALLATDLDGALLIGSYLSAWLFNYVMSRFLRHILEMAKVRRGVARKLVDKLLAYMDDVTMFSDRQADLLMAIKQGGKWLKQRLGLELKPEVQLIGFVSIDEERRRRKEKRPSARGCPGLDMMGYVVHRTYVTIRPRVFLKARRQYLRATRDLEKTGRVPLYRAFKLTSYYGPFKNTNSRKAQEHLDVQRLVKIAKATIAQATRARATKQKGMIIA